MQFQRPVAVWVHVRSTMICDVVAAFGPLDQAEWQISTKAVTLMCGEERPGLGRQMLLRVRRQNIRHNSRRRLAECGPRQGVDVRRRTCGAASADVRWSVA